MEEPHVTKVVKEFRDDVHHSIKQTKFLHHAGRQWCICGFVGCIVSGAQSALGLSLPFDFDGYAALR